MQHESMLILVGLHHGVSLEDQNHALFNMKLALSATDECSWQGVVCEEKIVTSIIWNGRFSIARINIRSIPPGTKEFRLHGVMTERSRAKIETRMLPRSLERLHIQMCGLNGQVDLTTLPVDMKIFLVPENHLVGTVDLTRLPSKIESVDLRWNSIQVIFVHNDSLPPSLLEALFDSNDGGFFSNEEKVELIEIFGEKPDSRIELQ